MTQKTMKLFYEFDQYNQLLRPCIQYSLPDFFKYPERTDNKLLIIVNCSQFDIFSILRSFNDKNFEFVDLTQYLHSKPEIILKQSQQIKVFDFATSSQRNVIWKNIAQFKKAVFIVEQCVYDQDLTGGCFTRQQISILNRTQHYVKYYQTPGVRVLNQFGLKPVPSLQQLMSNSDSQDEMQLLELLRSYICATKLDEDTVNKKDYNKQLSSFATNWLTNIVSKKKTDIFVKSKRDPFELQRLLIQKSKSNQHLLLNVMKYAKSIYSDYSSVCLLSYAISDAFITKNLQFYGYQPSLQTISVLTFVLQSIAINREKWTGFQTDDFYVNDVLQNEDYDIPEQLKSVGEYLVEGDEDWSEIV
ncbi:Hypothetical_protein [Hexamita inflata]|uniref:Hypothetical_protein n=1 Tax=Hexamita inflata TaxID=28002 RepID=A0ABP1KZM0_9EUKA